MRFKVFIISVLIICSLLTGICLAQNKVVVVPLMKKAPTVESPTANLYLTQNAPSGAFDYESRLDTIKLPGSAGVVKKLEVILFIGHTWAADLDVTLTHSGKTITLFEDIGFNRDGFFVHLDDDAEIDIKTVSTDVEQAVHGKYNLQDDETLASFNGMDASGNWDLIVTDDSLLDFATLYSWGLYIIVDAATQP